MLKNEYVDTSVQKGGVPGVPGCLEHTSIITQIIREVKENGGELAVLWLDLANAYGSIPHKLVHITITLSCTSKVQTDVARVLWSLQDEIHCSAIHRVMAET